MTNLPRQRANRSLGFSLHGGEMAEREGFEPFFRIEAKSWVFANFVEFQFLGTGDKKQRGAPKGRQKHGSWKPCGNLRADSAPREFYRNPMRLLLDSLQANEAHLLCGMISPTSHDPIGDD